MIHNLRLQHFRSYNDDTYEFDEGVNIIVGPNASGKTNLLESILVINTGGSYRAKDNDLIKHGEQWARVDTTSSLGGRTVKIDKSDARKGPGKTFEINGKTFKRLHLTKKEPTVLFEPNHLLLLSGGPERRRDFLDNLLEQINPQYGTILRQYKRTLSQRNALLKVYNASSAQQMFAWNIRLSELADQLVTERLSLVDEMNTYTSDIYSGIAQHISTITTAYVSQCDPLNYATNMLQRLEDNIEKDSVIGFTSVGPHRDDILIQLNGNPLQSTASRGENRTMVLVLKIIELKIIEQKQDTKPILLLDDVFSELDGARRQALTEYLSNHQTFITTTDADVVVNHFIDSCRIIPLS